MSAERAKEKTQEMVVISSSDILFECPSCGKSLVVEESAEGLIIGCPQCRTNVIVPPRQNKDGLAPPPQMMRAQPSRGEHRSTTASKTPGGELSPQERLAVLTGQLKEIQAQRTEVTNRIASRLNEVNRDLVMLARLETSQQQILSEWNQLMEKIAVEQSASATGADPSMPVVVGSGVNVAGRTRVSFRE